MNVPSDVSLSVRSDSRYNLRVDVEPLVLSGERISLEPMQTDHVPALCDVGLVPELWKWTLSVVRDVKAMDEHVRSRVG
jgi:hypothetical protein